MTGENEQAYRRALGCVLGQMVGSIVSKHRDEPDWAVKVRDEVAFLLEELLCAMKAVGTNSLVDAQVKRFVEQHTTDVLISIRESVEKEVRKGIPLDVRELRNRRINERRSSL